MRTSFFWGIALFLLFLASCNDSGKVYNDKFPFLDSLGIIITDQLLLGDTLTLPDVYCGDPNQKMSDLKGLKLNPNQYLTLVIPAGVKFADAMSNWLLLGVRDVGNDITLAAYYQCNNGGYCLDLMTYDKQGRMLDAINAREQHLIWRIHLDDASNDTVFTLDGHFTFNANRLTLHRVMGRATMDFYNDLKGQPIWQQGWDQDYIINDKGHFVLQGQHVVMEKGEVDQYAALDFKSWDMLVCSLHDPSIMDTWNDYTELVNSTYDPDYEYNPFPWDVIQLYNMNPQRFLHWMAAHRNAGNRLLPCFKMPTHHRPALLEEIARIEDPDARQWLTTLVNSWDDKPLTKHL